MERIVDLSKYAWLFRYPGEPVEPSHEEAQQVLSRAQGVVEEITGRIVQAETPDPEESA